MIQLQYGQTAVLDEAKENYVITGNCVFTGQPHSVIISVREFERWQKNDVHIQFAMPRVSVDDREFLISGTSPEGWEQLFGSEE